MKVILLAPTPPPAGGIAAWTARMQNTSLKNDWKVVVVDEKVIDRDVFGGRNKKNYLIEMKRCWNIWKNLWKAMNDSDTKIVHSCIPAGTTGMLRELVCAALAKLKRKKFIIHYRCTLPYMVKNKISLLVFYLLTISSDLAIVLNKNSEIFVRTHCKTETMVIPNFIEKSELIKGKHINDEIKKILYVGGTVESKGCIDIIKVAYKFPKIEFQLIGNPDEKIINIEKPNNVFLYGEMNKTEVKKAFLEADVFMFVSYFEGEGFSNALAEAMANGLPCIVTDWAANKDMVEDNGGIIVPIKDTDAMINAINRLIKNKQLRQKQSKWNIDKVISNYIDDIVTNMYVDEYENLLKGSSYNGEKSGMGAKNSI